MHMRFSPHRSSRTVRKYPRVMGGEGQREGDIPELQVVVARQVVVRLDPILQRCHGAVREAHGRVILDTKLGLVRRRHCADLNRVEHWNWVRYKRLFANGWGYAFS